MIEELKQKLGAEVEKLQHELNVTLPNEIRKAVELGDLRENSEYKAALERQQFVQARLGQLRQRLSKLSQIDLAQIPTDKVGLGSRVVVEDEATKTRETFNLVFGDSVDFEDGHVSMASPIGKALVGKAVGDVAMLKLPASLRRLKIIELATIHSREPTHDDARRSQKCASRTTTSSSRACFPSSSVRSAMWMRLVVTFRPTSSNSSSASASRAW
jgi:transcription elongation factor GreA